ncbi:MAG: hypothetical protein NXI20_27740 [bacterium]|nr:hypothetical protein [bacterium]
MTGEREIYFHVGLGKIASTYLQKSVFPKLQGIHYISSGKYKKRSKSIIAKSEYSKYLVSREFDRQFEREVRWFTETYPDAKIIILLRRHDSWIASQYRRYVKNGWYHNFDSFLDLDNDEGMWKQNDLKLFPRLKIIEECCEDKPLILFHDELIEDQWRFLDKIAKFSGTTYVKDEISTERVHTSFSEDQLRFLKNFCSKYIRKVPRSRKNKIMHWLLYRSWWALFHLIMYAVPLFPKSWIPEEPLIEEDQLKRVKEAYKDDWKKVKEYAAQNNSIVLG